MRMLLNPTWKCGHLLQVAHNESINSPLSKFVIQVLDMDESVKFYNKALGMRILRRRYNVNNRPHHPSATAYLVRHTMLLFCMKLSICFHLHSFFKTHLLTGVWRR